MNGCRAKWRKALVFLLAGLLAALWSCALAEEVLPLEIDGTGTMFVFNVRTGKVTVPDCILLEANAFYTAGELSEYFSSEYVNIFRHLSKAEVSRMQNPEPGEYDPYESAGLELQVQSAQNSAVTAYIRLRPRNQDDYPEYRDLVDLEMELCHSRNQPDERRAVQTYQLSSYDLWNCVVRYTLDYYEQAALKDTVRIEYRSIQDDSGADAPAWQNASVIQPVIDALVSAEKLDHDMAGTDYMHLRCIDQSGKTMNVYLQHPRNDSEGITYVRMGAYCYRADKNALQQALNAAIAGGGGL